MTVMLCTAHKQQQAGARRQTSRSLRMITPKQQIAFPAPASAGSHHQRRASVYEQKLGRFLEKEEFTPTPMSHRRKDTWIQRTEESQGKQQQAVSRLNLVETPVMEQVNRINNRKAITEDKTTPSSTAKLESTSPALLDARQMLNTSFDAVASQAFTIPTPLSRAAHTQQGTAVELPLEQPEIASIEVLSQCLLNNGPPSPLMFASSPIKGRMSSPSKVARSFQQSENEDENNSFVVLNTSGRMSGSPQKSGLLSYRNLFQDGLTGNSSSTPKPLENPSQESHLDHRSLMNASLNGSLLDGRKSNVRASESPLKKARVSAGRTLLNDSFQADNEKKTQPPVHQEIAALQAQVVMQEEQLQRKLSILQEAKLRRDAALTTLRGKIEECEKDIESLKDSIDSTVAEKQKVKKKNVRAGNEFYERKKVSERAQEIVNVLVKHLQEKKEEANAVMIRENELAKTRHSFGKQSSESSNDAARSGPNQELGQGALSRRPSMNLLPRGLQSSTKVQQEEALRQDLESEKLRNEQLHDELLKLRTQVMSLTLAEFDRKTVEAQQKESDALNMTIHMKDVCERAKNGETTFLVEESVLL